MDLREQYQQMQGSSGYSGGGGGGSWGDYSGGNNGGGSAYSPSFSWQQFLDQQRQVQQANQQYAGMQNPFIQQRTNMYSQDPYQQDQRQIFNYGEDYKRDDSGRLWRKMNDAEKFFAGANDVTNALSNYSGWDPSKGFTPENVGRFALGLPGMMLSGIPDALATGYEIATQKNIKESDTESGYMLADKLTGSQVAADVGYLGLDLLGFVPGIGVEGKVAGTIAKGVGKASGLGNVAAKGLTKSAGVLEGAAKAKGWTGGKLTAAKFGDTASDIAASTLFEGAQEAGQTGFEDIRYQQLGETDERGMDTFGRMAEAGAWGAVGGLIPGTTTAAANYGIDKFRKKGIQTQSQNSSGNEQGSFQPTTPEQWSLGTTTPSGVTTQAQQNYWLEKARSDKRLRSPGAIMALNVSADPNLLVDEGRTGSADFLEAFEQGDKDALAISRQICNQRNRGVSDDVALAETRAALYDKTVNINGVDQVFDTMSDALNALEKKYWGNDWGFRFAWEKSPATKNRGGYLHHAGFFEGKGLIVHPYVAPLTGMDFDGDVSGVHLNTYTESGGDRLNLIGYASEIMRSREGVPQSDIWYSDFREGRFAASGFKETIRRVFNPYKDGKAIADNYAAEMEAAVSGSNANYDVVEILDDIQRRITELNKDDGNLKDPTKPKSSPLRAINRLMNYNDRSAIGQVDQRTREIYGTYYADMAVDIIESDPEISDDLKKKLLEDNRSPLYAKGRLGKNGKVGDHYQDLGLMYYTFVMEANQPFRQHAQLNLNFGKRQGAFTDLSDGINKFSLDQDVLDVLVRTSFRIAKATTTPLSAIEGMLDSHTFDVTYREAGLDKRKISSGSDFDNLLETLRTVYNSDTEVYSEVKKAEQLGGYEEEYGFVPRNPIDEKDKDGINRIFLNIFGNSLMEDVFDERTFPEQFKGFPVAEVVAYYGKNPAAWSYIFTESGSTKLEQQFNDLVSAYGSAKKMAGRGVERLFRNADLSDVAKRAKANGGKIEYRDYGACRNLGNAIVESISPSAAEALGLNDIIYFFESTDIGKKFLFGTEDERLNSFYVLLVKGQFINIQRILSNEYNFEGEDLRRAEEWAINQLELYKTQSPLKKIIAEEMIESEDHSSKLLEGLTSINISYQDKMNAIEKVYGKLYPDMDPIADFMIDGSDDFSVSAISKRKVKSENSMIQYQNSLMIESTRAIDAIEKMVFSDQAIDEGVALAAIESAVHSAHLDINVEPYVVAIVDSMDTGLAWNEKGINPASFASAGEAQIYNIQGGPLSYIDQLTSFACGAMSAEDFGNNRKVVLSIFADRSRPIRLFTTRFGSRKTCYITGDQVFAECSPQYNPEIGPTFKDWMLVLRRFPQLEGYLTYNSTQPMMVNGEGASGVAKITSLDKMVENYASIAQGASENGEDARIVAQIDYGIQVIGSHLLNDRRYVSNLIHCMEDLGLPENASIDRVESEFKRLHSEFATSFFFNGQWRFNRDGKELPGRSSKKQAGYIGNIERTTINHISDALESMQARFSEPDMQRRDQERAFEVEQRVDNQNRVRELAVKGVYSANGLDFIDSQIEEMESDDIKSEYMEYKKAELKTKYKLAQLRMISNEFSNVQLDPVSGSYYVGPMDPTIGISRDFVELEVAKAITDAKSQLSAVGTTLTPEQEQQQVQSIAARIYAQMQSNDLADELDAYDMDMSQEDEIAYVRYIDMPLQRSQADPFIDEIIEKLDVIRKQVGDHTLFPDMNREYFEKLYDDTGILRNTAWVETMRSVDSAIIQQSIADMNNEWSADLNKNAFVAQQDYVDTFYDLCDDVDELLSVTKNPLQPKDNLRFRDLDFVEDIWSRRYSESYSHGFPVPDFSRSMNMKCATDMSLGLSGALVPGSITRNGGMLKQCSGLGYLSYDKVGTIEPRPMTLGELRDIYRGEDGDEVSRWHYVKSGDWNASSDSLGKDWEIGTLGHLLSDETSFADDAVVRVFHPDDNPNGILMTNTPACLSEKHRPSVRFANINGVILDTSQENMVLKLKKRFEAKLKLVDEARFNVVPSYTNGILTGVSAKSMMDMMRRRLLVYRDGYMKEFMRAFNDELKETRYGKEQARIMAQGLTPGVVVTVGGKEYVISAEHLWNEASFTARIQEIFDAAGSDNITACQVLSISPTEASARINAEIDKYNQELSRGSRPVGDEARRRATNVFTNWDDYFDNELTVDEIFGTLDPVGRAHNGGITTETSYTYVQRYLGLMHEKNLGSVVGYEGKSGRMITKENDAALFNASKSITSLILGDNRGYQIVRAFGIDDQTLANYEREQHPEIRELMSSGDVYWGSKDKISSGLVQNKNGLRSAIKWGKKTGNYLLVTQDVLNQMSEEEKQTYQVSLHGINSNLGKLYIVNPSATDYDKAWSSSDRSSGLTTLKSSDILGTYIDGVTANLYNMGDADIWCSPELTQYIHRSGMSKLNANSISGARGKTETIGVKDAQIALSTLFNDDGSPKQESVWKENGYNFNAQAYEDLDFQKIAGKIRSYLQAYVNGNVDDDGVWRSGAGSQSCITLIKVTNIDGQSIVAPIIAPKNTPVSWDHCYFSNDRMGNIYLGYTSRLQLSGDPNKTWFFKMSLENEAFKGIASPVPDGTELPTFGFENGRESLHMAATWDTEKSRVPGRSLQMFIGSLWYFSKRSNMSMLRSQDGSPKKVVVDAYTTGIDQDGNPIIDEAGLHEFLNGDLTQWERFRDGELSLVSQDDPNYEAKKAAIQKAIKAAWRKVPLVELFSHIDARGISSGADIRYFMAFKDFSLNEVLLFFNAMDRNLCPNGCWDDVDERAYWFNRDGLFRISYRNKLFFAPVRWAPHNPIADFSEVEGSGGPASESNQSLVRMGLEQGFLDKDLQTMMDFSSYLSGNPGFYHQRMLDQIESSRSARVNATQGEHRLADVMELKYGTAKELAAVADVMAIKDSIDPRNGRKYYDGNDVVDFPWDDSRVQDAVYAFNQATGLTLTPRTIEVLSISQVGHTYNNGKGSNSINVQDLADSIRSMARSITDEGLVVLSNRTIKDDRVSQPLLAPEIAQLMWTSESIRNHPKNADEFGNPSFEVFANRMKAEQDRTDELIAELPPNKIAKARELSKASEYYNLLWGRHGGNRLYENSYTSDLVNASNWLTEGLRQEVLGEDFDYAAFNELEERTRNQILDRKKMNEGRNHAIEVANPNPAGGNIVSYKNTRARGKHAFFRNLTDLSRLLGVADIWLPVSNIGYRGLNQSMMSWIMAAGRHGVGPFKATVSLDQKIVKAASNDPLGFDIWMTMHDAALTSDEMELMVAFENEEDLQRWIDQKAAEADAQGLQGRFNKWKNLSFRFASGGSFGMKQQFANFINRFACFCNEDPQLKAIWLTKDSNGYTRLDRMLAEPGGAAQFLKDVFGGRDGGSASYQAAMNAMQSIRTADIAQDHILMEIFKNITNKHPIPEFLLTTVVSRFPRYGLNFTEEILNYVMPVSSIRYIMTDWIAQRAHAKAEANSDYVDPHYELLQRNTSLKEAFMVDMLHLGPHLVAMLIAAIPGACEPPDDDKKWGNPQEWIICGHRVGETWWMEDILGLALPMVCFQKSVMLGKPRLDLLVNGVANVCYSNPMLKVADAVSFMMDPFDGMYADYEEMKKKYDTTSGGQFGILDYIQDNFTTFGYSYASQFITPTFVKSAWNLFMPYEYDYRHAYKENDRGVLTEKGEAGEKLVEVDYDDAMLRRLTRKNPVLALVIDLTHPGNTSYSPLGFPGKMAMPLTVYNDQHQYDYMKAWTIEGLSEADQQAKCMQILITLEEYQDNLDALISTGFYLDSGTKAAVSSLIWDQYWGIEQSWNQMQIDGELDFYYLGNGDYETGRTLYYTLKQQKDDAKRYYSDLYNKTMKSEQLSKPMVTYNRYNTTYAQDDDGNWYATGFRPQGVLPFTSAPGSLSDAEGTAGYENDWVTISAVDGRPLEGMRALVPTNANDYEQWPNLKSWSDDGEGEGFSKQYQQWTGKDSGSATNSQATDTTSSKYPKSTGYPRKSYGGGGGRRGGGGGGGGGRRSGGYVPNISSPNGRAPVTAPNLPRASLSKVNPSRIMNTDRLVEADGLYLRPDFETKGSREAYKRSDI